MITVKGFTDKDAKYTTFQQFKNCHLYRQSLFQILPRGSFEIYGNDEEQNRKKIKEYGDIVKMYMYPKVERWETMCSSGKTSYSSMWTLTIISQAQSDALMVAWVPLELSSHQNLPLIWYLNCSLSARLKKKETKSNWSRLCV